MAALSSNAALANSERLYAGAAAQGERGPTSPAVLCIVRNSCWSPARAQPTSIAHGSMNTNTEKRTRLIILD